MFGHSDNRPAQDDNVSDHGPALAENDHPGETVSPPLPPPDSSPADDQSWQHPGAPLSDQGTQDEPADAPVEDSQPDPAPASPLSSHDDEPTPTEATPAPHHDDLIDDTPLDHDLIDIKQKALGELSPLVDHLEQSPEERFRTLMMMIQASDDQSLIKAAYEAAQSITDEKVKAQALLDIVNEINYFSQNGPQPKTA